ncbi:Auxin response factor 14 [Triticum urartu]|uniref:Auxin response factor n=1 Tax=Triticum urartu TaxID=4572 RepID=M7YIC6_TRIUA|nr:Auxin response factor 14 [Triticum urartu]
MESRAGVGLTPTRARMGSHESQMTRRVAARPHGMQRRLSARVARATGESGRGGDRRATARGARLSRWPRRAAELKAEEGGSPWDVTGPLLCGFFHVNNDFGGRLGFRVSRGGMCFHTLFNLADAATDEVYARLALVADAEMFRQNVRESASEEGEDGMAGGDGEKKPRMPHMFCKTLTASDTSTHGGFSVPRRAAEDCFAPLDYKQVRPSQELVAKDLHGTQWRFRHIYRGQPRRHLLTTGWSSFVNKKKLVSGDAVLFLRGDDGELRLGVRRAVQLRNEALFKAVNSNESKLHTLSAVASSLENRSIFHVCFDPRSGASEFIVPYWRFSKSLNHSFSIGMRFKDSNESDDANERSTGLISGISEVDPIRWPGSKWRCLQVRWDDGNHCNHQRRVSPWEIERVGGSISVTDCLSASSSKRAKLYFPQGNLDAPVTDGNGYPDSVETGSFHRVLQGQELLMGSRAHGAARSQSPDVAKFRTPDHQRFSANARSYIPQQSPVEFPYHSSGFGESLRFPEKVLGGAGEGDAKEGDADDVVAECADPRVLDLFGRGHPAPGALHAIVAAPLGM